MAALAYGGLSLWWPWWLWPMAALALWLWPKAALAQCDLVRWPWCCGLQPLPPVNTCESLGQSIYHDFAMAIDLRGDNCTLAWDGRPMSWPIPNTQWQAYSFVS